MAAPASVDEFLDLIRKSGVVEEARLGAYVKQLQATSNLPTDLSKLAGLFVRDGLLTYFQAEQFLLGKWKRFTIGKYKVLERIGSGGMGQVFLCEHKLMRRKVAVKVLPTAKAEDPSSLERFYREARAVAALDHPNIVRAYDIDQDDNLHFLVMEYVDGASLQDMIKKWGPMDVTRACHYMYGAAVGLQHAHEAGLIHRDIKPGNILIDRQGTVKILDMGLARFFNDDEDLLTKKYDESVLGTADYLAPEQAIDSHSVDGRADIYSLGATFYFLLAGSQPFVEGTVAQKLIWHQTRNPKPIRDIRSDVPAEVSAIIEKMMAKDAAQRYQNPRELAEALSPWVQTQIAPPPEREMPQLSAAAQAVGGGPQTTTVRQIPPQPKSGGNGSKPPSGMTPMPPPKSKGAPSNRGSQPVRQNSPAAVVSDSEDTRRRSAPAPIVETMPSDSEGAVWESLAADTNNTARDKTSSRTPAPYVKPKSVKKIAPAPKPAPPPRKSEKKSKVSWLIAALVIAAAGASFCVYWFVLRTPEKKDDQKDQNNDPRLTVSKPGGSGKFNSVRDALSKAKEGDHIIIEDSPWEEDLQYIYAANHGKGITIEGVENKEIVWRLPPGISGEGIIKLADPRGLKIRNLKFDGGDRIGNAILVGGNSAGLIIEDIAVFNTKEGGVKFKDCIGGADGETAIVQRARVVCDPNKANDAGITFFASDEVRAGKRDLRINEGILVRDCRFEGPFRKGAFSIQGNTNRIELLHNRVFQAANGVYFGEFKAGYAYRVRIVGNTFFDITDAGIHFKNAALAAQPPSQQQQGLDIEQDYFATNAAMNNFVIIRSDDNAPFPFRTNANNARNSLTKEGNPPLNATPVDAPLPVDPKDDRQFLRYDRSSPLFKVAPNSKPVGVPPAE